MKKVAAFLMLLFLASETAVAANPTSSPIKTPANKGSKKSSSKQKSKQTKRTTKDPTAVLMTTPAATNPAREYVENTLLVMPFSSTDEDTHDLIKEVDGEIAETIGEGSMTVWVIRFKDSKKFEEAEKTLSKDKKLKSVERDRFFHAQ